MEMKMYVLNFAFLLSVISAVDPQKTVNTTEISEKLHSLEAYVANLFAIVSKELTIERAARQGLVQELNMTKTSWSISYNDALQQM